MQTENIMKRRLITSESYSHEFVKLSANELFFSRSQEYKLNSTEIDCYGNFWSFLFADIPKEGLVILNAPQKIVLSGLVGILVPPHTLIHWQFLASKIKWYAFASMNNYPKNFPQDPHIFSLSSLPGFLNETSLSTLISTNKLIHTLTHDSDNIYASNLKKLIDNSFMSNQTLNEFASTLNISKEWLVKYFKKTYGIPPIAYRNKKRLMQAFILLHLHNNKILDLSHDVGFNDLKQFNELFKQNIRTQPSKFL